MTEGSEAVVKRMNGRARTAVGEVITLVTTRLFSSLEVSGNEFNGWLGGAIPCREGGQVGPGTGSQPGKPTVTYSNRFLGPFVPSAHCFEPPPQATSQLFDIHFLQPTPPGEMQPTGAPTRELSE
jgi:hypothetical protein